MSTLLSMRKVSACHNNQERDRLRVSTLKREREREREIKREREFSPLSLCYFSHHHSVKECENRPVSQTSLNKVKDKLTNWVSDNGLKMCLKAFIV